MIETDVLVVGGSAGGILAALSAKKTYKDKKVTVVRMTKKVMVPCGIPYIFGTLKDTAKNVIPDSMLTNAGIDIIIDEVLKIDKDNNLAVTRENGEIKYDKMIMATGSLPLMPTFIPGYDIENVYPIKKDEDYLKIVQESINNANDIVVIGGGFIGVEMAEQIKALDKNVTLIEIADKLLWQAFDAEYSDMVEAIIKQKGVVIKTNTKVTKILGETKVEGVELENGEIVKADIVILGMGVVPNTKLAKETGIKLNEKGAIVVDEYMRTSAANIFAVGDCAEKKCFFTRKNVPILLASTAANEAKIAGVNVFNLRLVKENKGTISAFSTKIYDTAFAAAGLTEVQAKKEGFDIVIGEFSTMDKHPGSLPNAKSIKMKLIFSRYSGVIIGAQISGGESVGEMINILSLAIQKGLTASELNTFQTATHPLLTASPVSYPINSAALDALSKM
ncbi:CoA-disulfide reductase [Thermoanaerobacterium xylanolyticum LX-11]|uniref:CoA-disulfide reductase n=1 Tax=Thermoanaerobacterium xylanolyticum (strain ATCC 49914 / DSM 7097 / LX-11) TaxID=858215 RepID=F6BJG6_THEXL|nr:FAD-dependent oxidoreductase [Thermoanaerobacterium xylanolyticum]AEF16934.1 CoA-disulfide reductase [Thermoanaerobacterium xylanolyticum LX-11]